MTKNGGKILVTDSWYEGTQQKVLYMCNDIGSLTFNGSAISNV